MAEETISILPTPDKLAAQRLAVRWPVGAMLAPETGLPTCIETTKLVVEAFRQAGYPEVRPLPVALHCFNRQATMQVALGAEVPGAVRVEVDDRARPSKGHGWSGHLVVEHPDWLLDLVLPAVIVSTGASGFDHVQAFYGEKGNHLVEVDGAWIAVSEDGTALRYEPRPRLRAWKNLPAWRGGFEPGLVSLVAKWIEGP